MSGPSDGACAHPLIHCSFNGSHLPCNGNLAKPQVSHESPTPRQEVLGRIRVPAPRVLTEAARAQGEVLQTEAVPQRQGHALVVNLPALQAQALFCSALVVTPKAAWRWADCEVRVLTGFMESMAFDLWKKNKPSDQAGIVPLPCNYS